MKITLTALAMSILIAACGQPEPQPAPNLEATVQTMVQAALPTETPTSVPDVAVAVATGVAATMEALPSASATATATPEPPPPTPTPTRAPLPSPTPTLAQMVEGIASGLVYIETSTGSGSGFIVDADGLVVTNAHVVERFESVDVAFADGSEYRGSVLGVDEIADLALVRLQSSGRFEAIQLGNSDGVQVGDDVIALGFPLLYELGNSPTVTRGIISSKRTVNGVDELQTDAAINPGNSGGPLVDRHGSVIGVNYAELALSDGSPVDNIGFSVAINELISRMDVLAKGDAVLLPTPMSGALTEYRNEDFGYAIDVAPGWYLDEETAEGDTTFWNEDRTATLDVYAYEVSADISLAEFAEYVRDDLVEIARADAWDVFEIIDFVGVQRDGAEYYRLEYKWRSSDEFCISRGEELIILSSHYPAKPYGFSVVGDVCEYKYDYYGDQVNEMVGSFVDWTTPRTALAPTPTSTPEPWTEYRNEDFGYAIDVAPGWYLSDETEEGDATFWSADDSAFLEVFVYDLSGDAYTLAEFANWIRDDLSDRARKGSWEVFEILDFAEVRRDTGAYYWLEYNWQESESDDYCVTNVSRYIVLSSHYSAKPYGFSVNGSVCDQQVDEYSEQLVTMIGSFADWTTPRAALAPTPTPEPWTQYRNDVYNYTIGIAPGWHLDDETDAEVRFRNEDSTAALDVLVLDLSQTNFTLTDFAEWRRDDLTQTAALEDWDVFDMVNLERGDGDFYWLSYRWWTDSSEDYCVSRHVELLTLSSRYPATPYGFSVGRGICEASVNAHADIVGEMIASFATY